MCLSLKKSFFNRAALLKLNQKFINNKNLLLKNQIIEDVFESERRPTGA